MLKKFILTLSLSNVFGLALGMQSTAQAKINQWQAHSSLGLAPSRQSVSLASSYEFQVLKKFFLGPGLRYSSFYGQKVDFTGAEVSILRARQQDTLTITNPWIHSLNLAIYLSGNISENFRAGFNLDLIGVSTGGTKTGNYQTAHNGMSGRQQASPTPYNVFLIDPRDIGTLNSEFWIG